MKLANNIDVNKNQLLNALLQIISGDHATPVQGLIWYDSAAQAIKFRDATTIRTLGVSGAGGDASTLNTFAGSYYLDRTNHTGTQSADSITDGTTNKAYTAAEKTKLAGVATGATANSADATLLARANHTGSQVASTISDFAEAVSDQLGTMVTGNTETGITVTYDDSDNTLDFVLGVLNSLPAPTGSLSLNSQLITNLLPPVSGTDAANKTYVDNLVQGISAKTSVRAATTASSTLASTFENADVIDGVTLATGDRILIKNQSTGGENGIYTVNASGAPTRAVDMDTSAEVAAGMYVFVEEGTANADSGWVLTTDGAITIGTTALSFVQFSGAGQITDGNGLTKSGNTLSVVVDSTTIEISSDAVRIAATAAGNGLTGGGGSALAVGAGTGISVAADAVAIDTSVVARKYSVLVGNGASTSIAVTHNLGIRDVQVQVYDAATYEQVLVDNVRTDTNNVTLTFAVAPASNAYKCVVIG
jgi:hypothetical protein